MTTSLLTAGLIAIRRSGLPIVTTVHGVVDPSDVTNDLLARNGLPGTPRLARYAFRASYRAIAAASDKIVVHHDHFGRILQEKYEIPESKIQTVPMGSNPTRKNSHRQGHGKSVLVLGFLTGYKLPELVVELAESNLFAGGTFRFCVGMHPRLDNQRYLGRYRRLEKRVRRLDRRAEWLGYIPDEGLSSTLAQADILVLPYTECVSASGIAALAHAENLPICYSRPLRALFGPGPLEFDLSVESLAAALAQASADPEGGGSKEIFVSWKEAGATTERLWRLIIGRE